MVFDFTCEVFVFSYICSTLYWGWWKWCGKEGGRGTAKWNLSIKLKKCMGGRGVGCIFYPV